MKQNVFSRKRKFSPTVFRWIFAGAAAAIALALTLAGRLSTEFADWYCQSVYPIVSFLPKFFWGLFPLSVAELLIFIFVLAFLLGTALLITLIIRRKGQRLWYLLRGGSWYGLVAAVIFLLLSMNCLVGYNRTPFSAYSGLTLGTYSAEQLRALADELVVTVNETSEKIQLDENGLAVRPDDFSVQARRAMEKLAAQYDVLDVYYPQPKSVMLSAGMSSLNIAGIFFPFTVEANINCDMPDSAQGFTAAHELSHLSGFMREDEANFLAYLACRESESDYFRYSGALGSLVYVLNAYHTVAASEQYAELYYSVCEQARLELATRSAYWAQFQEKVTYKAATAVNDAYLKSNNQTDGTKSYGRVVDLMLAEFLARNAE